MIRLRPARSTDAGKLGAMITDAVAAHTWKPVLHSGAEDIAHAGQMIAHGWVTVAEVDGTVAGFIARQDECVHALFVTPDAQGQGVGRALLREAKAHAPELVLWTFQANTGAQRFYRQEGFVEDRRTDGRDNDEGLPDIRFTWARLSAPEKENADG